MSDLSDREFENLSEAVKKWAAGVLKNPLVTYTKEDIGVVLEAVGTEFQTGDSE